MGGYLSDPGFIFVPEVCCSVNAAAAAMAVAASIFWC